MTSPNAVDDTGRAERIDRLTVMAGLASRGGSSPIALADSQRRWCVAALADAMTSPARRDAYLDDLEAAWVEVGGFEEFSSRELPELFEDRVAADGFEAMPDEALAFTTVSPVAVELLYEDLDERITESEGVGDWFYDEFLAFPAPSAAEETRIRESCDRTLASLGILSRSPRRAGREQHASEAVRDRNPTIWFAGISSAAACLLLGFLLGSANERAMPVQPTILGVGDIPGEPSPHVFGPLPEASPGPSAAAGFRAELRTGGGGEGSLRLRWHGDPTSGDNSSNRFVTVLYLMDDGTEKLVPAAEEKDQMIRPRGELVLSPTQGSVKKAFVILTQTPAADALRKVLRQVELRDVDDDLRLAIYRAVLQTLGHADIEVLIAAKPPSDQ